MPKYDDFELDIQKLSFEEQAYGEHGSMFTCRGISCARPCRTEESICRNTVKLC